MKKIVFLTGTRSDYSKLKSVINTVYNDKKFEVYIYVTGMHIQKKYGNTYKEIISNNYKRVHISKLKNESMDIMLSDIIKDFSKFINKIKPDMIFVHGDRIEALAGAIVGALNNIYVSHIEGGELTGSIDESIRHSISKMANYHFVSNNAAKKILIQLGEDKNNIFVVGSPNIDIIMNNECDYNFVKKHYKINFDNYGILIYHPVTTEVENLEKNIKTVVDSIIDSKKNYIVIYPNNDTGSNIIIKEYDRLKKRKNILLFSSIKYEYFLTLLKKSDFVLGNSSLGIKETGLYGIPTINIGSRQNKRFNLKYQKNIICINEEKKDILNAIDSVEKYRYNNNLFGDGHSAEKILSILKKEDIWNKKIQKSFIPF